jgi:UDP-galactopyranose mutase
MLYDIIIFGGGISGLTLSHELIKKGFKILIVEKDKEFGGMARSIEINNIPSEHSWRGYAPFYKNTFKTLKEIPYEDSNVFNNLSVPVDFYLLQDEIKKYKPKNDVQLFNVSATELYKKIKPASIDAIVTEAYLGPQRGRHDIRKTIKELETMYSQAIKEFKKVLKNNGKIIMIWPVFRSKKYFDLMTPVTKGFKIVDILPDNFQNNNLTLSKRNTIIYGRSDQKVWREIIVLKKQ